MFRLYLSYIYSFLTSVLISKGQRLNENQLNKKPVQHKTAPVSIKRFCVTAPKVGFLIYLAS